MAGNDRLRVATIALALLVALTAALTVWAAKPAGAAFPIINGKIAFVSDRAGNDEIYTVRFTGDNLTRLTHDSKPDSAPSWSSDGKKVAFERGRSLYTMNAYGSRQRKVPNTSFYTYDLACVLSTGGFAMGFMSIAKPSFSSSSWAQAVFLRAG